MSWADEFGLKDAQVPAATTFDRDVSVTAGAGSGKTRTLTARYVGLLDQGRPPRALAAVTFTEKAAREMRNRIRGAIHAWRTGACPPEARARWEAIEAEIDTARIGTIHALCAQLLRAHPAEAEIDPRFEVLEEGLAAALRAQSVEDALNWASGQAGLQPLFEAMGSAALADVLSRLMAAPSEAHAALAEGDSAARWGEAVREALRVFAQSDETRSAIGDLRALGTGQRLEADAGAKLADQVRALTPSWDAFEAQLDQGDPYAAASALFGLRRGAGGGAGKSDSVARAALKALREAYDEQIDPWLGGKAKGDPPPDAAAEKLAARLVPLLAQVFDRSLALYRGAKDQRQALDFDDLEAGAAALLQKPEIRARWQRQIAALMVDEFQDTNSRQRQIVEALAGTHDGLVGRLFVVGDAKQSIYRFRGADVTVFRAVTRAIGERAGRVLELNRTYRAHPALVESVNELMAKTMGEAELPGALYRTPFAPLTADRGPGDARLPAPHVEFLCGLGQTAPDARPAAAHLLARRLRQLRDESDVPWDHVALLFRASTAFPTYEAALEAAGIPFVTVAGRGFYDRPEIRDVLNMLRALADPWDDASLAGLLRSPAFGLSDAALYRLRWSDGQAEAHSLRARLNGGPAALASNLPAADRELAIRARDILAQLQTRADRVPVAELIKDLLDQTFYPAVAAGHAHGARLRRNWEKLLADAHQSGLARLSEFLEYVETLRDVGAREGEAPADAGGAVRLMTVHKAKGLEFPVVVIADAGHSGPRRAEPVLLTPSLGLVPAAAPLIYGLARQAEAAQAEAEAARLLYVAATRAREKLIVSGHTTGRASNSWLAQLAEAAGLDLEQLTEAPGEERRVALACGQPVTAVAEGMRAFEPLAPDRQAAEPGPEAAPPLFAPLSAAAAARDEEPRPSRPRRVTGRLGKPEGVIAGELVHECLRRWRFPGESGCDRLLTAAARTRGLVDPGHAAPILARARELLARLRGEARFAELEAARRAGRMHHEVPYSLPDSRGVMDLMYQAADGAWHVVDFKTDAVADEADLRRLIARGYEAQLRRYARDAAQLLGAAVGATLCFLDCEAGVRWHAL